MSLDKATLYTLLTRLDEPKRYLTLTLDELVVAGFSLVLLMCSNQKIVVGLVGFFLYATLKKLKQGGGPRVLLVLAYWHLPRVLTQLIVPTLPASYLRVWVA